MIVELFGPPASGKTTFACALAARFLANGRTVKVRASARPGEAPAPANRVAAAIPMGAPLYRLAYPLIELIAAAAWARGPLSAEALLAMLSKGNVLRTLRMRQYVFRLGVDWEKARASGQDVVFDQGYVQAIASILSVRQAEFASKARAMLRVTPAADLAIRVEAPERDIELRLAQREQALGRIGMLFESKEGDVRERAQASLALFNQLKGLDRAAMTIDCGGAASLDAEVARAAEAVEAIATQASQRGPAESRVIVC